MMLLAVNNLSLAFAGVHALSNVSFNVATQEIVGLIGPNGAGKSTLLNCLSRLYRPDGGLIVFEQTDLLQYPPHIVAAMGIRRTFQNLELFREATVHENVVLGSMYRFRTSLIGDFLGSPAARRQQRAAAENAQEILVQCGLSAVADAIVRDLPYGTQKAVELARAMAGHPKLLLLDEPAAGMNPDESRGVVDTVRRLRDRTGASILLIEHDMRVVMNACDRIVVLDHGEKIGEGTPAEVRRMPAVIKAYLGDDA